MLTSRGFWLLLSSSVALLGGAALGQLDLVFVAASLAIWIGASWTWFVLRTHATWSRLRIEREIAGQPPGRRLLWAEGKFHMTARVVAVPAARFAGSMRIQFGDRLPRGARLLGAPRAGGVPGPVWNGAGEVALEYDFQPVAMGRLRFEGFYFVARDPLGLFEHEGFLRQPFEWLVLPPPPPPPSSTESRAPTHKRLNLLPARGVHRHLRAGSASELLDLRDYVPGDPPRTIAWKASARRRVLMTKCFESEVPIRATLFLDASSRTRRGGGHDAYSQLGGLAIRIARALLAAHDPVGLCIVHDHGARLLPARPGGRQLTRILSRIAASAAEPVEPIDCPAERLLEPALELAREIDPRLFRESKPGGVGGWLVAGWRALRFWVSTLIALGTALAYLSPKARAFDPATWLVFLAAVAGTVAVGRLFGMHRWTIWPRSADPRRRHLAAILASWSGASMGEQGRLEQHDRRLAHAAQRYLAAHDVPTDRLVPGTSGSDGAMSLLCRHLLRSVAHGRDNELLVLLVDFAGRRVEWEAVARALRVAAARHHQAVVVCPILDGAGSARAQAVASLAELRDLLAPARIPVLAANDRRALDLILGRVERMRFAAR